ncbi:MAG: DUF4328 domain-containing protein [Segniliparus sp.]|uniref:DUF4328 domain-containing protein n=1 Tax=Segniliparus sp. TaxID=2804064 RepID=UPI003F41762E
MTFPPPPAGPPYPQRPHLPGLSGHWPSAAQQVPADRPPTRPSQGPSSRIPVLPPGYRWHAFRPPSAVPQRPRPPRPTAPTPRYASPPRWGLVQHFPQTPTGFAPGQEKPTRTTLIEIALYALVSFLALFAFAAALRYGLAFYGRGHLVPWLLAGASDVLLSFAFWSSVVMAVAAEAALAWWLWVERDLAYTANNRTDPRRWWEILLLALLPLVNLVALGVLLKELLAEHVRSGRRDWQPMLKSWWIWWACGHLAVLGFALWSLDRSVQARTEALLLGAVLGLVLLFLVLKTYALLAEIEASKHPRAIAESGKPARWVVAAESSNTPEPVTT